ncbi:hypothetical protein [Sphingomonas sp. IC4-52]|uniref:hypothetical protein n=1 Tax=Sphingomonas sp. IC4-52 TaxID=2887202 RepID=UPI001D11885B|nr:hypothetical protein [Sphingomonas sp. IC4-52]MCC2978894.1 hypothetical protein [Sphingomonas sp. IC4-52]
MPLKSVTAAEGISAVMAAVEAKLQTTSVGAKMKDQEERSSPLTIITTIAAPVTIIGAATLYFTGSIYQHYVFRFFGLSSGVVEKSIQQTMADGYAAVLQCFYVPAFLILATWFLLWMNRTAAKVTSRTPGARLTLFNVSRAAAMLYHFFIVLLAGFLCGVIAAEFNAARYFDRVEDGCKSCFVYVSSAGQVIGLPLDQDAKSFIVVTRTGVQILPGGSLKAVRRINPPPASVLF